MAGPSTSAQEYDADLLKEAPQLDKKRIQEGYTTDILNKPAAERKPTPTPTPKPIADLERNVAGTSSAGHETPLPTKPVPFFKTTRGRVIIGIVVLAAVVAGVVGGVVGSRNSGKTASAGPGDGADNSGDDSIGTGATVSPSGAAPSITQVTGTGGTATTRSSAADGTVSGNGPLPPVTVVPAGTSRPPGGPVFPTATTVFSSVFSPPPGQSQGASQVTVTQTQPVGGPDQGQEIEGQFETAAPVGRARR